MMLHGSRPQSPSMSAATTNAAVAATAPSSSISNGVSHNGSYSRKRKASSQNNERLSKRLSLLNIGTPPTAFPIPIPPPPLSHTRDGITEHE